MLKKVLVGESHSWDQMVPYVLFAYKEVPQESTGFSHFELIYSRDVRGPLDVLKESLSSVEKEMDDIIIHGEDPRKDGTSQSSSSRKFEDNTAETQGVVRQEGQRNGAERRGSSVASTSRQY